MTDTPRPDALFVGETPALDFLNSIAQPKATEYDWLETGQDVLDWFAQAGLATKDELIGLSQDKAALEQAVQDLHDFRMAFRGFIADVIQSPDAVADHPMIDTINHILETAVQYTQMERIAGAAGKTTVSLVTRHPILTAADLLPRIASACAVLICEADLQYLRNCEGPSCTLYFLDVSKNHKRRWCAMEVCGNRAKAAAHREAKRKKDAAAP